MRWCRQNPAGACENVVAGDPCSKLDFDWAAVVEERVGVELELLGTGETFTFGWIDIYMTEPGQWLKCPGASVVGDTGPTHGFAKSCQIFSDF